MKILGWIMILIGVFIIFAAGRGCQEGRTTLGSPSDGPTWETTRDDPKFDKTIRNSFIGGIVMVGLGVVFVCTDDKYREDE